MNETVSGPGRSAALIAMLRYLAPAVASRFIARHCDRDWLEAAIRDRPPRGLADILIEELPAPRAGSDAPSSALGSRSLNYFVRRRAQREYLRAVALGEPWARLIRATSVQRAGLYRAISLRVLCEAANVVSRSTVAAWLAALPRNLGIEIVAACEQDRPGTLMPRVARAWRGYAVHARASEDWPGSIAIELIAQIANRLPRVAAGLVFAHLPELAAQSQPPTVLLDEEGFRAAQAWLAALANSPLGRSSREQPDAA